MNRRWKLLIGLGVFLVLLAASLIVMMHTQPAGELETYKKSLRAKGEKLEIGEILPPPVAPEENSVDAVRRAFAMFSTDDHVPYGMRMAAPGKAMVGWMQPDARGSDYTISWGEFAARLAADQPAFALLRQVLERPKLDFQLDYTKDYHMPFPQIIFVKRSEQKLEAEAILDLHNGNSGEAATNILTLLALIHNDTRDDLPISQSLRFGIITIVAATTWELLQATNVTDAQLAAIQNGLRQLNFLEGTERVMVMEEAMSSGEIEMLRASHEKFRDGLGDELSSSSSGSGDWKDVVEDLTKGPRSAVAETLWRSSWSYADELQILKNDQLVLEAVRAMEKNKSEFYKADLDAIVPQLRSPGTKHAGEAVFEALEIPNDSHYFSAVWESSFLNSTLRTETARRLVMTAIALKRFQLKHGKWPETLDQLAPEFIASVPIDPYDGKPLKYHPNADGTYLLYSVGEDGVDNGGDPSTVGSGSSSLYWLDPKARDWVWPQPATPAEVKYFYEHPSK